MQQIPTANAYYDTAMAYFEAGKAAEDTIVKIKIFTKAHTHFETFLSIGWHENVQSAHTRLQEISAYLGNYNKIASDKTTYEQPCNG